MDLASIIRTIPDHPKPGIMFRDITTLLSHGEGFAFAVDRLADTYRAENITYIAGIEARGFAFGAAVARALGVGFVPVRKKGKLPGATLSEEYTLEYGTDVLEIHTDAVTSGDRVAVIDDLIATGGTALAAISLLKRAGAQIVGAGFVIDLPDLGGARQLVAAGVRVTSLVTFQGE